MYIGIGRITRNNGWNSITLLINYEPQLDSGMIHILGDKTYVYKNKIKLYLAEPIHIYVQIYLITGILEYYYRNNEWEVESFFFTEETNFYDCDIYCI